MLVPTQGLKLLMSQARKLTFTPVMAQVKPSHKVPHSIESYCYNAEINQKEATLAKFSMDGETYYIDTNDISLKETNDINRYIAETLNYSHSDITSDIEKSFEQTSYKTDDVKPLGIIIHDTGVDNSTIDSEVNYMVQNYEDQGVFVHSFIDSDTILRIANENTKLRSRC